MTEWRSYPSIASFLIFFSKFLSYRQNKTCADEAEMKITESHNHQHMPASKVDGDAIGIFDQLGICDSRVPELCSRAGQPAPYLILQV